MDYRGLAVVHSIALHERTHPLSAHSGLHLHRQVEPVSQVVNGESERVVGPLHRADPHGGSTGRWPLPTTHAVPVVEERREQRLRRRHPALRTGAQSPMMAAGDVVEFVRIGGGEQVFVAANLGDGTAQALLPPGEWRVAGQGLGADVPDGATEVTLGPWQVCLMGRSD